MHSNDFPQAARPAASWPSASVGETQESFLQCVCSTLIDKLSAVAHNQYSGLLSQQQRVPLSEAAESLNLLTIRYLVRKSSPGTKSAPCHAMPCAYRWTVDSWRAISVAFAVLLSTIWASSSTTRHHVRRVRGVGTISYLPNMRGSSYFEKTGHHITGRMGVRVTTRM